MLETHILAGLNFKYKDAEHGERDVGDLSGLQMYFANGNTSPFFEIEETGGDVEGQLEIDTSKEIGYVSMGLRGGLMYTGITFYDKEGTKLSNYTWSEAENALETPKYEIPSD